MIINITLRVCAFVHYVKCDTPLTWYGVTGLLLTLWLNLAPYRGTLSMSILKTTSTCNSTLCPW